MANLKELISIGGIDTIAEISLQRVSAELDSDGNTSYGKRVDRLHRFEAKKDEYGSPTSYEKVFFTRQDIMEMYQSIINIESGELVKMKPASDIDDDLPW